jgi:hypothetical protein
MSAYMEQITVANTAREVVLEDALDDIRDGAEVEETLDDLVKRVQIIISAVESGEFVPGAKEAEQVAAAHAEGHATAVAHGDAVDAPDTVVGTSTPAAAAGASRSASTLVKLTALVAIGAIAMDPNGNVKVAKGTGISKADLDEMIRMFMNPTTVGMDRIGDLANFADAQQLQAQAWMKVYADRISASAGRARDVAVTGLGYAGDMVPQFSSGGFGNLSVPSLGDWAPNWDVLGQEVPLYSVSADMAVMPAPVHTPTIAAANILGALQGRLG